jgi:hypothetical protein
MPSTPKKPRSTQIFENQILGRQRVSCEKLTNWLWFKENILSNRAALKKYRGSSLTKEEWGRVVAEIVQEKAKRLPWLRRWKSKMPSLIWRLKYATFAAYKTLLHKDSIFRVEKSKEMGLGLLLKSPTTFETVKENLEGFLVRVTEDKFNALQKQKYPSLWKGKVKENRGRNPKPKITVIDNSLPKPERKKPGRKPKGTPPEPKLPPPPKETLQQPIRTGKRGRPRIYPIQEPKVEVIVETVPKKIRYKSVFGILGGPLSLVNHTCKAELAFTATVPISVKYVGDNDIKGLKLEAGEIAIRYFGDDDSTLEDCCCKNCKKYKS